MKITPTLKLSPILSLSQNQRGDDFAFLKPGQLFSAKVVGQGEDGTLEISLNDRLLRVLSDRQLMEGTKISVKVELKEGQIVLRLLDPLEPSTYSIQNALRQVMPKQQPLQPLFEQLARIALSRMPDLSATTTDAAPTPHTSAESEGVAATLPTPLPPLVEQAIASLISQLPSRESVTHPDRLKGVIENSGLFLESRILGSDSGGDDNALLERDLKTTLLRLASLIRQSLQQLPTLTTRAEGDRNPPNSPGPSDRPNPPPQSTQQTNTQRLMETSSLLQRLAAHSEGAIAAIQTQQLFSLQAQQQSNEMLFNLEIPLFNGKESEQLGLKIRREGRRHREAAKTIWSVTLKLDNDDYGTIRAVVTLIDREVSTTFWCEQGETRELFTQHMEELRQRINEQGLELGRTQAFTGTPPEPNNPDNAPHPNGILRTQA